jgi:2-oxoacid:acceptor oxidoreductase delta subunit (pyruvate/2-ketoisovalerate family)
MYCPEPAILWDEVGGYTFDYRYCKGCGICARECPYDAISMVEECEE